MHRSGFRAKVPQTRIGRRRRMYLPHIEFSRGQLWWAGLSVVAAFFYGAGRELLIRLYLISPPKQPVLSQGAEEPGVVVQGVEVWSRGKRTHVAGYARPADGAVDQAVADRRR